MSEEGLRSGFVVLSLAQVGYIVSGYATHVALARTLGPASYGTYGVTLTAFSTVALVLTGGMPEAIAKLASEKPAESAGIFARGIALQLRFSLVLAAAYLVASPLLGLALHDSTLTPALAASALAVPPTALYAVALGAFNGQRRFVAQALTVAGYAALRALLVIGLALRLGIQGAVAGFIIAPLVIVAFVLPGFVRRRASSTFESKELWVFARPVIGFTIALALLMSLDLFFVKSVVRDADAVGYYAAAGTVAKVPYFFFSTLGVVLLPIISSAGGDTSGRAIASARAAIRLIFAIALGVAAVLAPFSRAIINTIYGARYEVAVLPLGLLLFAMTFFTLVFIVAYTLNGLGKPGLAMRIVTVGLGLQVVLAFGLTPIFGSVGAAASSCLTGLSILVALVHYAKPATGELLSIKSLLRICLALALTLAGGFALPHARPSHLLLTVPLALGYLAALLALRELNLREIGSFLRREQSR